MIADCADKDTSRVTDGYMNSNRGHVTQVLGLTPFQTLYRSEHWLLYRLESRIYYYSMHPTEEHVDSPKL